MADVRITVTTRVIGNSGGYKAVTEEVQELGADGHPIGPPTSLTSIWTPEGTFLREMSDPDAALHVMRAFAASGSKTSTLSPNAKNSLRRKTGFPEFEESMDVGDQIDWAYEILDSEGDLVKSFHLIVVAVEIAKGLERDSVASRGPRPPRRSTP